MAKARAPLCRDCSRPVNVHPWTLDDGSYVWLCGPCKYRRERPDAAPPAAAPWERRPLPLQSERLF